MPIDNISWAYASDAPAVLAYVASKGLMRCRGDADDGMVVKMGETIRVKHYSAAHTFDAPDIEVTARLEKVLLVRAGGTWRVFAVTSHFETCPDTWRGSGLPMLRENASLPVEQGRHTFEGNDMGEIIDEDPTGLTEPLWDGDRRGALASTPAVFTRPPGLCRDRG